LVEGKDKLKELLEQYHKTNIDLSPLLAVAQKGAVGETMIEKATSSIKAVMVKLNMDEIFSRMGALPVGELKKESYGALKESL